VKFAAFALSQLGSNLYRGASNPSFVMRRFVFFVYLCVLIGISRGVDPHNDALFDAIGKVTMLESKDEENPMDKGMTPLKKELQRIGKSLLESQAENLKTDSGVKESKRGDWEIKSREKTEKNHQDGVKSYKAGVAEVKDKKNETTNEKAHEVRKMSVSVRGSDPQSEKSGNFFRSVKKTQMVQKSWERNAEAPEMNMMENAGFKIRNDFPGFPSIRSLGQTFPFAVSSRVARESVGDSMRGFPANSFVAPLYPFINPSESSNLRKRRLAEDEDEEHLLQDLETKILEGLKDDEAKKKFSREMDEALEVARADEASTGAMLMRNDDAATERAETRARDEPTLLFGANEALPAWRKFSIRRRPTFFID